MEIHNHLQPSSDRLRFANTQKVGRNPEVPVVPVSIEIELEHLHAELSKARDEQDRLAALAEAAVRDRDIVLRSTSWRATWPLRATIMALKRLAYAVRHAFRRGSPTKPGEPGAAVPIISRLALATDAVQYNRWIAACGTLTDEDRRLIAAHIDRFAELPLISVVMPVYETPELLLREAIESVRNQIYPRWELCIADDASPSPHVEAMLRAFAAEDQRIRFVRRQSNGHISAATNTALSLAQGEFVALMDHDDVLAEHALYEIAAEANAHPETDIFFSDEDRFEGAPGRHRRHSPYFKPDWDPDLILGHNAVSHLGVYRRELLIRIGGLREGFEGSQDYDLILRAAAAAGGDRIRHIPAILYHWRLQGDASFSDAQLDRCIDAARRAITEHLRAMPGGPGARVVPNPRCTAYHRVVWPLPEVLPRVSIIVPTRDRADLLERCVSGLLHRTNYPAMEILIVDNGSTEADALRLLERLSQDHRIRLIGHEGPFNYSALNNLAARQATGDILVLLNNDIDVLEDGWLLEMVSHAVRLGVGTVGARLLYGNGTVQHAGVVLGWGTFEGGPGVAGHFGWHEPAASLGYFAHSTLTRTVCANTGACLAVRRDIYMEVGGLDEANLPVAFNDVDFCLRVRERGYRNVWTPFAELLHLESASRGRDDTPEKQSRAAAEVRYMRGRWGDLLDNDPYYNANFARFGEAAVLDGHLGIPARRIPPWRLTPERGGKANSRCEESGVLSVA